jgi:hypothetical protein
MPVCIERMICWGIISLMGMVFEKGELKRLLKMRCLFREIWRIENRLKRGECYVTVQEIQVRPDESRGAEETAQALKMYVIDLRMISF